MDFNTTKPDTQNEPVKILIYNRTLQFYNKNQKECNTVTSNYQNLFQNSNLLEIHTQQWSDLM